MKRLAIAIGLLVIVSCNNTALQPKEYVKWIEDESNGLKVKKELGNYIFTLQYKPLEYVALQQIRKETVNEKDLQKEIAEISDLQYYTFQIEMKDRQTDPLTAKQSIPSEYYSGIEYFSFKMQKDLQLIEGKDTLYCMLHHFERTYGATPYNRFVMGFEKTEAEGLNDDRDFHDRTFIYNDHLLGVGKMKILIKGKDINNIPGLITN